MDLTKKSEDAFEECIREYLLKEVEHDECLKAKVEAYTGSLEKAADYCKSEAMKLRETQTDKNCVAVKDSVVYGWIRHYFLENGEVETDDEGGTNVEEKKSNVSVILPKYEIEEEVKKVKKPKSKTKANENQMSIFDLLGDEGGTNA